MENTAKILIDRLNELNNEEDKITLLIAFSDEFPFIEEEIEKTMSIIINKLKKKEIDKE